MEETNENQGRKFQLWNFLIFYVGAYLPYLVLFDPSFIEYSTFLVVDLLCTYLFILFFDSKLMAFFHPDTKPYFMGLWAEEVKGFTFSEKSSLFYSLLSFPKRRAQFLIFFSFVKVIPALTLVVFFWDNPIPIWLRGVGVLGIILINFSYFYGFVFLQAHHFASQTLRKVHEEFDWSDVFSRVTIPRLKTDFEFQTSLSLGAIILMMLFVQWFVIANDQYSNSLNLALKVTLISLIGISLCMHLLALTRKYLADGIRELFEYMDQLDYKNSRQILPLHSTEILARFEKSFNLLVLRLKESEQELASWAISAAEKSRYRTIGEISGLVAHDLTGPLHVARFCIDELREDPCKLQNKEFISQLSLSVGRAIELVDSLRARLKNPVQKGKETSFVEAHRYVIRLLRTQYLAAGFDRIKFDLDEKLVSLNLKISRTDLIHILDNLYRNAIDDFLGSEHPSPQINISLESYQSGEKCEIHISDNGSGLTQEYFYKLTDFEFVKNHHDSLSMCGLGLKLTRRLVELNEGSLDLFVSDRKIASTTFQLYLKEAL